MHPLLVQEWRESLTFTSELETPGEKADFYKRLRAGEFVQLLRGVYLPSSQWVSTDRHDRYRWQVKAAAAMSGAELLMSHESAAAMWRLPALGPWPDRIHVLTQAAAGGRSTERLVRHTVGVPEEFEVIDGIRVTSMARTVVDLARTLTFGAAVTVADAALRRTRHPIPNLPATSVEKSALWLELAETPMRHGSAKARRVIDFANASADRPGESISRVNMFVAGIPAPELQVTRRGASGRAYDVDFWWETYKMIGEFDGAYKYSDPEFLRGRSPERALLDEKFREDDLRAAKHGMTRWGWEVACSPRALRSHLWAAGIR